MIVEILKILVLLVIAIPFGYIIFDVVFDILKRMYEFSKQVKPVLVSIRTKEKP